MSEERVNAAILKLADAIDKLSIQVARSTPQQTDKLWEVKKLTAEAKTLLASS